MMQEFYKLDKNEFTNLRSDFLRNTVNNYRFHKVQFAGFSCRQMDPLVLTNFCELLIDSYKKN